MHTKQSTNHLFMIEPCNFYANPQTITTNRHQTTAPASNHIQQQALRQHQNFRKLLQQHGIKVTYTKGKAESPDDLFCNNWISTHDEGSYNLYPMFAPNRRVERRQDIITQLEETYTLNHDFSPHEDNQQFLESTGSLVLDRINRVAYGVRSPRTNEELFYSWCHIMNYKPILFDCTSPAGTPEYHTNVVMFIGTNVAGIYLNGIPPEQCTTVLTSLQTTHDIVAFTYEQIENFCGNALEVSSNGEIFLIMSEQAYAALTQTQKDLLNRHYAKLLYSNLQTIEKYGGGSARCLLLELF